MMKLVSAMHILHRMDKKSECLDYALKHFPKGHEHLDVWVLMDKDGNNSAVEVVNTSPNASLIAMGANESNVLLEVPYENDNLNLLSFLVATQEYSQAAKMYIELLESIITGLADQSAKELVTKRLAERV